MSSDVRNDYIVALYSVAKTDPAKWSAFVEAFKVYTAYELEKITSAAPEHAGVAIGFGRKMKEQRDDFTDIESLMDKIKR